jgi:hypothetical protein
MAKGNSISQLPNADKYKSTKGKHSLLNLAHTGTKMQHILCPLNNSMDTYIAGNTSLELFGR